MRRLGKYIVRGLLGRGGMSKVFKVEMGFVAGQDFSARCYVRAVCDEIA